MAKSVFEDAGEISGCRASAAGSDKTQQRSGVSAMKAFQLRHLAFILVVIATFVPSCMAHEPRPAYLEIKETSPNHYDVVWGTPVNAGMRLPILLQLPTDARNLPAPTTQELTDSLVERRVIEVPSGLAGKRIDFIGLQATITDVLVR